MPQTATQKNRQAGPQPSQQAAADVEPVDTEDQEYGLVSVLYHALQGVQACEQYVDDAERAGDTELATFFQECRDEQATRANRAKQLLAGRMDVEDDEDDEDEDDEDDEDEDDEDEDEES